LSEPCDSLDVGSIQVNSLGGTTPYSYSIEDLSSISYGENTISTLDTNGCKHSFDFYLDLAPDTSIELIISHQIDNYLGSVQVDNLALENVEYIIYDSNFNEANENELPSGNYVITYWNSSDCETQENFIVELLTSISEQSKSLDLSIHPNPTYGEVKIADCENVTEALLYSYQGELIKKAEISESCTIEYSELDSGTYILKLYLSDHEIVSLLLVKT
jgi:hypothetical protein